MKIKGKLQEYPVATTVVDPGSLPLRNRKQELYAQERALFNSATVSARNAGYKGHVDVVASELERKPKVQARITYLTRDHENALREKRKRLEEFLWDVIETDRATYYETVEITVTDRNGIPTLDRNGLPKTKMINQLKRLELLKPHERRLIDQPQARLEGIRASRAAQNDWWRQGTRLRSARRHVQQLQRRGATVRAVSALQ